MENTQYWQGFEKVARSYDLDPSFLLKIAGFWNDLSQVGSYAGKAALHPAKAMNRIRTALDNANTAGQPQTTEDLRELREAGRLLRTVKNSKIVSGLKGLYGNAKSTYSGLTPEAKYGLGGFALSALGSLLLSNGTFGDRLMKSLGYGTLGGLGAYGLKRSGGFAAFQDKIRRMYS